MSNPNNNDKGRGQGTMIPTHITQVGYYVNLHLGNTHPPALGEVVLVPRSTMHISVGDHALWRKKETYMEELFLKQEDGTYLRAEDNVIVNNDTL